MTLIDYLFNILLVGLVVLQLRGHAITRARLLFPVVATVVAVTQFLHAVPTAGNDLVLETSAAVVGGLLGSVAALATRVRRQGTAAFAKAGTIAAALWVLGIGARMAFAVWVSHGGSPDVARFSLVHHITSAQAWAAAFVLMALTEVGSRTGVLYLKARRSGAEIPRGGLVGRLSAA